MGVADFFVLSANRDKEEKMQGIKLGIGSEDCDPQDEAKYIWFCIFNTVLGVSRDEIGISVSQGQDKVGWQGWKG